MSSSNRKHEDVKEIDWDKTLASLFIYHLQAAGATLFIHLFMPRDEKEKV